MQTRRPRNKTVYTSKIFKVGVKRISLHGHTLDYNTVLVGKVAVIVPILDDGRILIEHNYRDTVDRWVYELPAGHVEKGESPVRCAERELAEETGYKPKHMKLLFKALASPGMSDEEMYIFLATGLVKGRQNREPFERIRLRPMTIGKILDMVRKGEEVDLKTIAGVLFYKELLKKDGKL